jgi:Ser/Thr protein kinase RdoA (MazF antagonist)
LTTEWQFYILKKGHLLHFIWKAQTDGHQSGVNMLLVNRSLINEGELLNVVNKAYNIPRNAGITFWRTGIAGNDIYIIDTDSQKYLLKIYFKPAPKEQIQSSLDIMIFLASKNINVPQIFPNVNHETITGIAYPEGERSAVLFEFIDGDEPDIFNDADAGAIGRLVGKMVHALDLHKAKFPVRLIDQFYLIQRALDGIKRYLPDETKKIDYLTQMGQRLWNILENNLTSTPPLYGICHGDLHTGNMIKARNGEIYLFDFDSCGYGYRIYDMGIYANDDWAKKTVNDLLRDKIALEKFLVGYNQTQSLSDREIRVFPYMLGIRHFELLGVVLQNCVKLEGLHWIKSCVKFHYDWFNEWEKTLNWDL